VGESWSGIFFVMDFAISYFTITPYVVNRLVGKELLWQRITTFLAGLESVARRPNPKQKGVNFGEKLPENYTFGKFPFAILRRK
jgi:hypothetical protein